jgi:phage gpG-like protein
VTDTVEVDGAVQLTAGLARFAASLDDLDAAELAAGRVVQQRASGLAPVRTGALARSITVATGDGVTVGSGLPYAGVQEVGWAARNIQAQPFLRPALADSTTEVQAAYLANVDANLKRVKGA